MLRERRSLHPIDRLSREFDEVCANAVDAQQIAASLEAEGINDRITRDRFAVGDVFALASHLHQRVPSRPADATPPVVDPPGPVPSPWALILRGPVYLAPVLFFVGGGDRLRGSATLWVALVSLLLAWVLNQGFGVIIHTLIGRAELAKARRSARQSLILGTSMVTLLGWLLAFLVFDNGWLAALAAVQTAYLISSASLLALSEDRRLLTSLAPGAVVAALGLITNTIRPEIILATAAATVAAVVAALWLATRDPSPQRILIPSRYDLRIAAIHALLGGVWATLIALAGYAAAPDPALMMTVNIAAAPVVMTMGIAEWQLARFRQSAYRRLAATGDPTRFALAARDSLLAGLRTYTIALLGTAAVVVVVARATGHLDESQFRLAASFVFLGCAMFAGMALVSIGRARFTLLSSAVALAATIPAIAAAKALAADPAIAYGMGCLALLMVLILVALETASRPVVYR